MMWLIINAAVSAFDIYIISSFYYRRLQKRVPAYIVVLLSAVCALSHFWMHYLELPAIWNTVFSVAICVILTFVFRATWKQRIFYPFIITALEIAAEIAAGLLISGLCRLTVSEMTASPHSTGFLIGNITAKLFFFVFVRVLCRLHVMNDSTLPLRHWLLIMLAPITSIAVCMGLAFSVDSYIVRDPLAPFLILTGVMGINTLAFTMYDELSAQSKSLIEHERAKSRMEADLRQYNAIISQSKEFAALLHDTRKHRETVYDLLVADDSSAAMLYLEGLLASKAPVYSYNTIKTSPAVDMILRRKIAKAENNGIKVICNFEAESALPVGDICLCLIFGNALDNAIDACKKIQGDMEKLIEIDVHYKNDRLTIRIANSSEPVNIMNNACATTKRNGMIHGYGLPNIQQAVSENGGNSVIRYEDGMFILSVIFLL